jgi:hypothetical protein
LGRHGPAKRFGEAIENAAVRAFHGYALGSEAIHEHAAIGAIKRKKVGAAQKIRALRIFLFQRFGILADKARGVLFAVHAQTSDEDQLLCLFLFKDAVTVAFPRGRQGFCAVGIEKLFENFFPAEFAHEVFIELDPIFAEQFFNRRESDDRGNLAGLVKRRVQNLLRGNGRLFKHAGEGVPSSISHNRSRKIQSADIGKD